jgi:hypothetical protein
VIIAIIVLSFMPPVIEAIKERNKAKQLKTAKQETK